MTIEDIARVCHEANRALCRTAGDESQHPWSLAEEWQRDSARRNVAYLIQNPQCPDGQLHENWRDEFVAEGWVYGPRKSWDARTHPSLVPFDELSDHEKRKDTLFAAVVRALSA